MTASAEYYQGILDETFDTESLTIFVVAGATQSEVADALQIDVSAEPDQDPDLDDAETSAYALADIAGGVVALEHSGYADPSLTALEQLSRNGRSAAVIRGNIQGHERFSCARDGVILFDDDQYTWVDKDRVPAELRELFDTAWVGPDESVEDLKYNGFPVGLAMAEVITGIRLTADDLRRASASGYRPAPCLLYVLGLEEN